MVVLTIEEWQRQSTLLIQARPTTTRITTKYNIPNLESAKYNKSKKRKRNTGIDEKEEEQQQQEAAPRIPRATLTLKTFDPESGVVLQFKTDRAADVGRAINGLGRLGRYMAALPEQVEEVEMHDAPAVPESSVAAPAAPAEKPQSQPGGGGAGGKKKKKGKK